MRLFRFSSIPAVLILLLAAPAALAQSMTVFGGNAAARECYMAATLAVQSNAASRQDLENCTLAIQYGQLSLRDVMATFVNRGVLYAALEDYNRAERDYATAIGMSPASGEVHINRGNVYFIREQFEQAVEEYSQGLKLGLSRDHIAHYNRAMAYERLGDLARAEDDFRRAVELVPQWFQPQARLDRLQRLARGRTATQ